MSAPPRGKNELLGASSDMRAVLKAGLGDANEGQLFDTQGITTKPYVSLWDFLKVGAGLI